MSPEVVSGLWILIAASGLVVNLYAVADAKIDRYYAQHHLHKGTRLLVAQANIRRERTRVLIQIAFLAAGILSLINPASDRLEGTRALIGLAMVVASVLTVFNSFADRRDRKSLLKLIDEQQEHAERNAEMRRRAKQALDRKTQTEKGD
jgi:hypothetical protein